MSKYSVLKTKFCINNVLWIHSNIKRLLKTEEVRESVFMTFIQINRYESIYI